jgi:hypothetical protein
MLKMKKLFSVLVAVIMVSTSLLCSIGTFSADEVLNVNSEVTANVGDKVTYSLYLSEIPEKVEDAQLIIYYDADYLTVDKDSINYVDGGSPVYNADVSGEIRFNCANGFEGWDFVEKSLLFEVAFTVKSAGDTDLSYYIQCLDYLSNDENVDTYVITCDYKVNDEVAKADAVPVVNANGSGGSFVNYKNGKGAQNGGDVIVGGAEVNTEAQVQNNDVVTGDNVVDGDSQDETTESTVIKTNSSGVAVTTPDGEQSYWSDSKNMWRNIGIAVLGAVIVCAIIISVVISKRKKKNNDEKL